MRWPTLFTVSPFAASAAPTSGTRPGDRPPTPRRPQVTRPEARVEHLEGRSLLSAGSFGGGPEAPAGPPAVGRPTTDVHVAARAAAVATPPSAFPRLSVRSVGGDRRSPDPLAGGGGRGATVRLPAPAAGRSARPSDAGSLVTTVRPMTVRLAAGRPLGGANLASPATADGTQDGSAAVAGSRGVARVAAAEGTARGGQAGRPPQFKPEPSRPTRVVPRVLVVEDDPVSRRALAAVLRAHGWDVTTAATAADGVRQLGAARPDAVLLDLMLPDGDGERVLAHARATGHRARVTVMTGSADPDRLGRLRHLGADGLLMKPIQVDDVLRRLAAA